MYLTYSIHLEKKKKKNTHCAFQCHFFFAVQTDWNSPRSCIPTGLPDLNPSQNLAVDKALNATFTLIWGPPGKTFNFMFLLKINILYFFKILSGFFPPCVF